jgi:ABC-2 type transport system permease protein
MNADPASRRASLATLTLVELRKVVDTRAGIAICAVSVVLTGLYGTGALLYRDPASIGGIALLGAAPGGTLIPVLAILLVTAERTHRTALATYALTPQRIRVLLAKALAAAALALTVMPLSLLVAVVIGAVGPLVSSHSAAWTLSPGALGRSVLIAVILALSGYALALAIGNAPASIVIVLVWPMLESTLSTASPTMGGIMRWLDVLTVTQDPPRAVAALAFWVAIPVLIGFRRALVADVR